MTAWNGEGDRFITNDKDTWVAESREKKPTRHDGVTSFEIPSEDWVEGFETAILSAAEVVEAKCYPTLVGEAFRSLARDVRAEWERRQHEDNRA